MPPRGRSLAVLALFVVLSVLHTWPVAQAPSRRILEHGDVFVNVWSLNDMARQMTRNPLRPFDGNIFHPYPRSLATAAHVFADALLAVPIRAVTDDPVLVYNIVVLITFVLSGFFTYLLVYELSQSVAAGLVAGCAFAFGAFRFTHFVHLHVLSTQWLPLALLTLHRFLRQPSARRLLWVTLAGLLVAVSSWHLALLGAPALAVAAGVHLLGQRRAPWQRMAGLALAASVVGLCLLPIGLVYRDVSRDWKPAQLEAAERTRERVRNSADVGALFSLDSGLLAPRTFVESDVFPGVAILILALPALLSLRTRSRASVRSTPVFLAVLCGATALALLTLAASSGGEPWERQAARLRSVAPMAILGVVLMIAVVRAMRRAGEGAIAVGVYATLTVAGVFLAMGPRVSGWGLDLGPGLYFYDYVPATGVMRAPARFSLWLGLGLAVLAGLGVRRLEPLVSGPRRLAAVTLCLILLNVDLRAAPFYMEWAPRRRAVHRWLAENTEPGAVVEYPSRGNPWAVIASLGYGRRVVNGISYVWPPTMTLSDRDALSPRHLNVLWEHLHPRFVVLRAGLYSSAEQTQVMRHVRAQSDALRLRAEFGGGDFVYELVDRGRGRVLRRYWPRAALEGRQGFELAGTLSGVPAGSVGRIVVELNGEPILKLRGRDASDNAQHFVPLPPDRLIEGLNLLEIRAEYLAPPATAHAIGDTGTSLGVDVGVKPILRVSLWDG